MGLIAIEFLTERIIHCETMKEKDLITKKYDKELARLKKEGTIEELKIAYKCSQKLVKHYSDKYDLDEPPLEDLED